MKAGARASQQREQGKLATFLLTGVGQAPKFHLSATENEQMTDPKRP
jgi:hypothetical protein